MILTELNLEELISRLPKGYEQAGKETKALQRKREIKTPKDLITLVFLYICGKYSQVEISILAGRLGIAKISDVAFLKRLAKCKNWLSWMTEQMTPKPIVEYTLEKFTSYKIVALDASNVTEKGSAKRTFRLHYAIDLLKMCSAAHKITTQKIGETLLNFTIDKNWLILADRAYGTITGIEHCINSQANFILRLKHKAFKIYDENGSEINILSRIRKAKCDQLLEIPAFIKLPKLGLTKVRICIGKAPANKLEEIAKRCKRKDSKKQLNTSEEALQLSQYVVLITALPSEITADEIVSLYRYRWQVEIYFKRLKSILDFGNIPLQREDSIHAWLNGKLLVSLLIEQMLSEVSFSP